MNSIKPKQREGSLRGIRLAKGEVIPLMSDNLFKKVYGDTEHLERLNYLLSSILDKDVKVIKILNNELIGDYRLNQKKYVDLVCKIGEFDYVNVDVNTVYNAYEIDRNVEFHRDGMTSTGIAYWTYDNVPSNCIVDIERFKYDPVMKKWEIS